MPDPAPAGGAPLRLPAALLTAQPHLPAFWPGRRLAAEGEPGETPEFDAGPFRPPRLGGRVVPVLLVTGRGPDPVGAALAAGGRAEPARVRAAWAGMAAGRIGGPPGLPDPGGEALGARGRVLVVLDPADPAAAPAARARIAAASGPVLVARDPFRPGEPVLPGCLPLLDPWTLLDVAEALSGASRGMALLAMAAGVRLLDGPFHGVDPEASWAALLAATRAADPFRNAPWEIEPALELLGFWKRRAAEGGRVAACLGMHPYHRPRLVQMLASAGPPPAFPRHPDAAVAAARGRGGAVLAWAASAPPGLAAACRAGGVDLWWLEDGFLRSAGLGAEFRAGASYTIDRTGPHYDPARPSDLESLLQSAELPPALLARAAALRAAIAARGITKYNLPGRVPRIAAPPGRRRILVPGQAEDDASVRLGGGAIRGNRDLLRAVRAAEPDAFLVYKPHPDIEAGFRRGRIPAAELAALADQVVTGAPLAPLLDQVEEVHVITSLAGFEALLRGLPVTCWGGPFYAGWGLTCDRMALPRRTRRRTLDELVAAALILYPRCVDPLTGLPCPPEVLLDRLDRPELFPRGARGGVRAVQGALTRAWARLRRLR